MKRLLAGLTLVSVFFLMGCTEEPKAKDKGATSTGTAAKTAPADTTAKPAK